MAASVNLEVTAGPKHGSHFRFDEHDTFVFGRMPDCHACLPDDDQVSRHHFLLEVNPPEACLRDLGSLNGTCVNGVKHGGRKKGETPEEGAQRKYPEVNLKDGDRIQVGQTVLAVRIEAPAVCCECGCAIAESERRQREWIGGTFICTKCKLRLDGQAAPPARAPKKAEADPMELLNQLLKQAQRDLPAIKGFEVGRVLGVGGCGAVYLARRRSDAKPVALKIMLSRVAVGDEAREKFAREIEVMRKLVLPSLALGKALSENRVSGCKTFNFISNSWV